VSADQVVGDTQVTFLWAGYVTGDIDLYGVDLNTSFYWDSTGLLSIFLRVNNNQNISVTAKKDITVFLDTILRYAALDFSLAYQKIACNSSTLALPADETNSNFGGTGYVLDIYIFTPLLLFA
jgi:hypothetical protein